MSDEKQDAERGEWLHALSHIHEGEHAELEFARTWADSVEVDYDEGPCAIGFKKGCTTYWYLIDDIGWDADDPRSELLTLALRERDEAREQRETTARAFVISMDRLIAERDEARDAARAYANAYDAKVADCHRLTAERDEARSVLDRIRDELMAANLDVSTDDAPDTLPHHVFVLRMALEERGTQIDEARAEVERHRAAAKRSAEHLIRLSEMRDRTAEAIADWLEARGEHHGKRLRKIKAGLESGDCDEHGWAESYADGWTNDIRSGAWRGKEGT